MERKAGYCMIKFVKLLFLKNGMDKSTIYRSMIKISDEDRLPTGSFG